MKKAFSFLLQFVIFLVVYGVGSLLVPFGILPQIAFHLSPTKMFVITGLLLSALVFIAIMVVHAVRRHPQASMLLSTFAFLLAVAFGLLMKFGFVAVGPAA